MNDLSTRIADTHGVPPAWVADAEAALVEAQRQYQRPKRAKAAALASMAQRRRDPLGKFLRSPTGKSYVKNGRIALDVSLPLALGEMFTVEAEDVKIPRSRLIAVLAALGFPAWQELRERFFTGTAEDSFVMPVLIKSILQNAVNPTLPRSKQTMSAWHKDVERALASFKKTPKKPKDPTAAMLADLGRGK